MFELTNSIWNIISSALVISIGLLVVFRQRRWFGLPLNNALIFYFWHSAFCLFFLYYSLSNIADATLYFERSLQFTDGPSFGTKGIYFLTGIFSSHLGMSYTGVFLVYNIFGFIGMVALAGALRELTVDSSRPARHVAFLVMLTPGLSFWSSAIGKDALSFMAAGLVVWSMLRLESRYAGMAIGCGLMLFVRPHVSGLLLGSLAVALLFRSRMAATKKLILVAVTIPAAVVGIAFGITYAGLDKATEVEDVAAYIEKRQSYNLGGGSSVDIAGMSIPVRMMSYAFRPLFFDASGGLGLVVSVESLGLISLLSYGGFLWFQGRRSRLDSVALLFFLLYSAAAWFVLANTTANLGIAIRQKWMFMPMLFAITFSFMPRQMSYHSSFRLSRRTICRQRWPRATQAQN